MVGLVKRLPYPWRSIVDAGVVAAARRQRRLGGAAAGRLGSPDPHPGFTQASAGCAQASAGLTQASSGPLRLAQLARGTLCSEGWGLHSPPRTSYAAADLVIALAGSFRSGHRDLVPKAKPCCPQVAGLVWGAASIVNLYVRALLGSLPHPVERPRRAGSAATAAPSTLLPSHPPILSPSHPPTLLPVRPPTHPPASQALRVCTLGVRLLHALEGCAHPTAPHRPHVG